MKSLMVLIAIIVSTLLVWSTSNVCKYNYAIEKNKHNEYHYRRNRPINTKSKSVLL